MKFFEFFERHKKFGTRSAETDCAIRLISYFTRKSSSETINVFDYKPCETKMSSLNFVYVKRKNFVRVKYKSDVCEHLCFCIQI